MEIVNYRVTVTQPDGTDHIDCFRTRDYAESYAASFVDPYWPTKVEEQRLDVEPGTVITVQTSGAGVEYTGPIVEFGAKIVNGVERLLVRMDTPRGNWWDAWKVVSVETERV